MYCENDIVNLQINLILNRYPVVIVAWRKNYNDGIDPQNKTDRSGYEDPSIGLKNNQQKSSQLRSNIDQIKYL